MRVFSTAVSFLFATTGFLSAQQWEVGAAGGYSIYRDASVSRGAETGKTGFEAGPVFSGLFANDMYRHFGGEARYTFVKNDLMVSSGATKATAAGQSHAIHYDVLIHGAGKSESVRPFAAFGAGVKLFRGTGAEQPFQPLSNLVVLTRTSQVLPLVSVGGGLKFMLSKRALVRLDLRDYVSPFPDQLLATPPSSTASGWVHNFVFMVGVSRVF